MGGIVHGRYAYTEELLALERRGATPPTRQEIIRGFLPEEAWGQYLDAHPDGEFANFLRRGIRHGFRVGYDPSHSLRGSARNHQSVANNKDAVDRYVQHEVVCGKLATTSSRVHTNPIGLIPKPAQPGKFRLIVDLSAPAGHSVNDGISPELCSLSYASVDDAACLLRHYGRGTLMAKLDLRSAYRMVPVHPHDQWLLGIQWGKHTYVDKALPFGLRSAPKIFNAVADGLAWAMLCEGIAHPIHYLDDFLFCGPPNTGSCQAALGKAIPICHQLGLPIAPEKVEGPSTTITFLGIEIDSVAQVLRLPDKKLNRLRGMLAEWEGRRSATKHQLQSLIGHLSHASKVVKPGRTFMREVIRTMSIPRASHHLTRLNAQCRADLAWWSIFLASWNGISLFPGLPLGETITADASGSWGCGAFCSHPPQWFQCEWPVHWKSVNIAVKEMVPFVVASAMWGHSWRGQRILFRSDNMAVVQTLGKHSAKDPQLAHLLRCLFFFEAHFGFEHEAVHVPGVENTGADALSRNRSDIFLSLCPQAASQQASTPPLPLTHLLFNAGLSWTSLGWRTAFRATLSEVSRQPPTAHMPAPRGGSLSSAGR